MLVYLLLFFFFYVIAIENILNDKVECTICKNDLMNEIVSKKMIMVHRIHLVLCCYVSQFFFFVEN